MAKFQEAIRWLRQGKKVRRKDWNEGDYVFLNRDVIINNHKKLVRFCNVVGLSAKDWEVFKEEFKTLSDKITIQDEIGDNKMYNFLYQYQVKEFTRLVKQDKEQEIINLDELDEYFPKGDNRRGEVLALLAVLNAKINAKINKRAGGRLV